MPEPLKTYPQLRITTDRNIVAIFRYEEEEMVRVVGQFNGVEKIGLDTFAPEYQWEYFDGCISIQN